jgi:hypothetical protein
MPITPKQASRRLSATVALVVVALYYAAVFRPLAQKEQDQEGPVGKAKAQLEAAASNNPAISGLSLDGLERLNESLRASLTNTALARSLLAERFAPEPVIATNLARTFQLIDYQNERLNRGDRLINLAGERKVKITPAVTAGLPEFTVENPVPGLLWGQLAFMDGVLRAAVECRVQAIEDVRMTPPVDHTTATNATTRLMELPLRVEVVGTAEALSHWLSLVLLDPPGRAAMKLPTVAGLPAAGLQRILARKETTDQPGLVRVIAEFSGFLHLPSADPASTEALDN